MTETDLSTATVAPTAADEAPAAAPQQSETTTAPTTRSADAGDSAPKGADGLTGMVLPELRSLAAGLGIKGASGMRKGDLISAIKEQKSGGRPSAAAEAPADKATGSEAPAGNDAEGKADGEGGNRNRNRNRNREGGEQGGNGQNSGQNKEQGGNNAGGQGGQNRNRDDEGEGGNRNRRNRRFRERNRRGGRDRDAEPQLSEDDVVAPVAGILDVLDNYAFVRTSGYLAGPNDVYVSMNLVRRHGLRRGDAITGAVKVRPEGEQQQQGGGNQSNRQKFNPLVRLDTVNGTDPESSKKRPDFNKLTPLYPNQRLRLETTPERLDTRVIDLIMPIGKGQRALIVSPPKAGKTTILQDIANAIATNNPECHLMVVLVDERPEEVTDMQRSVKGEVIASTFDRPPSDHTSVSELAIERAKRLVEQGKDVVVLLDSITRLGRAYNNASPASGRILSGGVDSTALYPPKRFLGAARNIENGGSLTIIASALVETGSTGDTVIFEEFKGTGNAELKLDRKIAERRVFPAVDVNLSSTRKDELLLSPEEFKIVHKLRRVLSGLDSHQAIDLLISQLKKTKNNVEFLMQVQSNTPGTMNDDD
ncbi:transcription termination factor Rho [Gordonia sp. (in: high G+C Gram-positive bacteria)]|uniref:transcription termination factor Rho n=1 Tax=Gordonia sp. (in: high G+C Gram-positive bacteria) TaxID=84139 RepID=UPI0039E2AAEB